MIARRHLLMLVVIFMAGGITTLHAQCTNLISNGITPSVNGSLYSTSPSSITDGSNSTVWSPPVSTNSWAVLQLGTTAKTVCKVWVKWGRWNFANTFKVQMTSTPGTEASWQTIATVTNNNPDSVSESGNYADWFVMNRLAIGGPNNSGTHIRLLMENVPSNANYSVSEFEVYTANTSNSSPSVTITSSNGTSSVPVNTTIDFRAIVLDPDGLNTIQGVKFYSGGTFLGDGIRTSVASDTFNLQWTPTAANTYNVHATVTDIVAATGNSNNLSIVVTPPNTGWGLLGNSLVNNSTAYIGSTDDQPFIVKTNDIERYRVTPNGQMLIGRSTLNTNSPQNTLLEVNGWILAKGLKITQGGWADYVFEKNYPLIPLAKLASYIKKYRHLPGVPSAAEVAANGISVGESQEILLKKIEELTLYLLQQQRQIDELRKELKKKASVPIGESVLKNRR